MPKMDRYEFLLRLISDSGEFLEKHISERTKVSGKGFNDYVTDVDKENETFIVSRIQETFPDDGIFGEEEGDDGRDCDYRWVIDPIDGTVNFMNSFPMFTISIAVEKDGEIIMGAVYDVSHKELFHAKKGCGAFLNGEKIETSKLSAEKSLALCVLPHRRRELLSFYTERMLKVLSFTTDTRSIGSAALSLCYVASGRCSVYYELCLHYYDFAAGMLILSEAGGMVQLEEREKGVFDVKSSAEALFERVLEATK